MSHELRTPLNAIIGYSEMLLEEADELGQAGASGPTSQKIRGAGKHLLGLINDILDLSKIEAGKMDVFLETFDVAALLDEVSATVEPLVAKNGNSSTSDCGPDLGTMRSDQTKMRQILFNLLSNAAKFTTQGRITLAARRLMRGANSLVEFDGLRHRHRDDAGAGGGALPGLQPGRRLDHPELWRDRPRAGHHPALLPHARRRRGRRKRVRQGLDLHRDRSGGLPAKLLHRGRSNRRASEAPWHGAGGRRRTREHRAARQGRLSEGYRGVDRGGRADGLRLAREEKPDAIILDVIMPDFDGWAVLRALKADAELCRHPGDPGHDAWRPRHGIRARRRGAPDQADQPARNCCGSWLACTVGRPRLTF